MKRPKNQLPIENRISGTPNPQQLIPTERVVEIAKRLGVSFGKGDPIERIRYYIKLGILPHQVRKSVIGNGSSEISKNQNHQNPDERSTINDQPATPIGHFPYWVVKRLLVVDRLNKSGMPFPEIAAKFKNLDAGKISQTSAESSQSTINNLPAGRQVVDC